MDKMHILLVDDNPEGEWCDEGYPCLRGHWADHFALHWIQNAAEGRWLLDVFSELSPRYPENLGSIGLPPEILVFDYALTGRSPITSRTDEDPTDVVQRLRGVLAELDLDLDVPHEYPPPTGAALGSDRTGCYLGGELARVFAAHPCGAVPFTAHAKTDNTEAHFYEWLNQSYFSIPSSKPSDRKESKIDQFKNKGKGPLNWDLVIPPALAHLRERMVHLVAAGALRISLATLQQLCHTPAASRGDAITVHSRYARRDFPLEALFADACHKETFESDARTWAERVLKALFKSHGQNEFTRAKEIAKTFYQEYSSETSIRRENLTLLLTQTNRSAEDDQKLDSLCRRFELDPAAVRDAVAAVRPGNTVRLTTVTVHKDTLPSLATYADDPLAARWAALMLCVRAEYDLRGSPLPEVTTKRGLTEIPRRKLEEVLGVDRVQSLLDRGAIRTQEDNEGNEIIEVRPSRFAEEADVLKMLEPSPESLLMWFAAKKSPTGNWIRNSEQVTKELKRLGSSTGGWGKWGLRIDDVLAGRPFNCPVCRAALARGEDPPSDQDQKHQGIDGTPYSHGIRPGEGLLLWHYADEIGFDMPLWPKWLIEAP